MHIVFCCQNDQFVDANSFISDDDHVTQLVVPVAEVHESVREINPQVLFLVGYDPDIELIKLVKKIKGSLPYVDLVIYSGHLEANFLLDLIDAGVQQILKDIQKTTIVNVISKFRSQHQIQPKLVNKNAQKIAFMSAKGGDGGTCVAANFAQALSSNNSLKVLCIDLSLPFGDLEMYLSRQKSRHDLSDFTTEIDRLDGALLDLMVNKLKPNLHIIGTPQSFDKVILINAQHIDRLVDIADHRYDYIIFDVGAGIDPISLRILDKLDQLLIVATLTLPSIKRATQLVNLWQTLGHSLSKVSMVVNRVNDKSEITLSDLESTVGKKVLLALPEDSENIQLSLIQGNPLVQINANAAFSEKIINWSSNYTGLPFIKKTSQSIWNRLKRK